MENMHTDVRVWRVVAKLHLVNILRDLMQEAYKLIVGKIQISSTWIQ